LQIKPQHALALVEYLLATDPGAKFRLPCSRCGRTTSYTREAILQMIPPSERARPLSPGRSWAFLLLRLKTEFDQNAFMGERVLVEVAETRANGEWEGRMVTASDVLTELRDGAYVAGETAGEFQVIASMLVGGQKIPFETPELRSQFNFALFLSPKSGDPLNLTCANVFCANPSCSTVFSMTFSEYEKARARAADSASSLSSTPHVFLECVRCGVFRIVDDTTFAGLAHV
jgi:hypothetical protein